MTSKANLYVYRIWVGTETDPTFEDEVEYEDEDD